MGGRHRLDVRPNYTRFAVAWTLVLLAALVAVWAASRSSVPPQDQAVLAAVESWNNKPAVNTAVPVQACAEALAARFVIDSYTVGDGEVAFTVANPDERRALATHAVTEKTDLGVAYVTYQGMVNLGKGWVAMETRTQRNVVTVVFRSGNLCQE